MEFLPMFLIRILGATPRLQGNPGRVYLVIRQPHAYLEEGLRQAFEGHEGVKVIVDRRSGERRASSQPVAVERRGTDRRRPTEELLQVVIGEVAGP
jgi:hypothetical protein